MLRMFVLAAAVLAVAAPAYSQSAPKVKDAGPVRTLLYIGNSFFYFNDSMHSIVLRLVAAGDPQNRPQYRSTSVTISGAGHRHGVVFLHRRQQGDLQQVRKAL
jgi:hypothetical protein